MFEAKGALAAKAKHVHSDIGMRSSMWEIGKSYTIEMWEDDNNNGIITKYYGCKVIGIDGTLIKIRQGQDEKILNTTSIAFVAAVRE